MSALNSSETDQLRAVARVLDFVIRNGYDPNAEDSANQQVGRSLKESKSVVNTITQMKGYYPK